MLKKIIIATIQELLEANGGSKYDLGHLSKTTVGLMKKAEESKDIHKSEKKEFVVSVMLGILDGGLDQSDIINIVEEFIFFIISLDKGDIHITNPSSWKICCL